MRNKQRKKTSFELLLRKTLAQVLPQYRPRPDGDRLKKKEKYDEALRFIQELMDCDEFEDISTLRVSSLSLFLILFLQPLLSSFSPPLFY